MKKFPMKFIGFALSLFLISCTGIEQKKRMVEVSKLEASGNYAAIAQLELKGKSSKKNDPEDLLRTLHAGAAYRYAGEFSKSSSLFDESEAIIKQHNEELLLEDAGSEMGSILVNDTILAYRGREYDGVMVNTYKALNFWIEGNVELARVEFNRALERQRRAKIRFAAEIEKQEKEIEQQQKENPNTNFDNNVNNPVLNNKIEENYSNLKNFKAYPDFINPFTTYIAGLFFMVQGDFPKASTLLKQSYGMVGDNPTVKNDFEAVEKLASGHKEYNNHTWVVLENGLGPTKEEFKVIFPITFLPGQINSTGIALPKLILRDLAYDDINISSSLNNSVKARALASMDRVVQTEFSKEYPHILTRTIISVILKMLAQHYANKEMGFLGGLAVSIYQASTTAADVRIWSNLPKEFFLAKIKTPSDGLININANGKNIANIEVPKEKSSIIFLKIPAKGVKPVSHIIKM